MSEVEITTRSKVKDKQTIALVGKPSFQITGTKLPSKKQVMQLFFYNIRFMNLTARESANATIKVVKVFWDQARIPVRYDAQCVVQILKLHEQWKALKKTAEGRQATSQKAAVDDFVISLDNLFDIDSADVLD